LWPPIVSDNCAVYYNKQEFFKGQTVISEKSCCCNRRSGHNADPARRFMTQQRGQPQINRNCYGDSCAGANHLPQIQPQKDFLLVMADFFIYRNLHITTPSFHG
jgi:hypothetical protein